MILTFQSKGEYAKLDIDRTKKKLVVTSKKTNYRPTPTAWRMLCDVGKEEEQEKLMDENTDEEFKINVVASMQLAGYTLKKIEG